MSWLWYTGLLATDAAVAEMGALLSIEAGGEGRLPLHGWREGWREGGRERGKENGEWLRD